MKNRKKCVSTPDLDVLRDFGILLQYYLEHYDTYEPVVKGHKAPMSPNK